MDLKVFLTDGSIVTVHDMTADDFRRLIVQYANWMPLDDMTVRIWDRGKGYININKIASFVEQKDEGDK